MLETINSLEKKQHNKISLYENGKQVVGFKIKKEGQPSEFKFFILASNQKLELGFGNSLIVMTLETDQSRVSWQPLEHLASYSDEKEAEAVVGSKRIQTTYL